MTMEENPRPAKFNPRILKQTNYEGIIETGNKRVDNILNSKINSIIHRCITYSDSLIKEDIKHLLTVETDQIIIKEDIEQLIENNHNIKREIIAALNYRLAKCIKSFHNQETIKNEKGEEVDNIVAMALNRKIVGVQLIYDWFIDEYKLKRLLVPNIETLKSIWIGDLKLYYEYIMELQKDQTNFAEIDDKPFVIKGFYNDLYWNEEIKGWQQYLAAFIKFCRDNKFIRHKTPTELDEIIFNTFNVRVNEQYLKPSRNLNNKYSRPFKEGGFSLR
jgi:hypothetical protein